MYQVQVDLCETLVPLDGQDCPGAGNYLYQMGFNLPGEAGQNWLWGWSTNVEALFVPDDAYVSTSCFLEVTTIETTDEMVAWSFAGCAILFATTAALRARRRRQVVANDQNDEGIEFQRMKDHARGSLVV